MAKMSDAHRFTMNFVSVSDAYKEQFVYRWIESLNNHIVEPQWEGLYRENSPYRNRDLYLQRKGQNRVVLKDPETNRIVMTYASKLVKALFGDPRREYIKAAPVGWEDAPAKAPTATKLLRRAFSRPGAYRSMVEAIIDMLLFGTAVVETPWVYTEREMQVRSVSSEFGIVTEEETLMTVPVYDDPKINVIDVQDFFPDPSRYRIEDMPGVAKRFRMNKFEAMRMAKSGIYDEAKVREAIAGNSENTAKGVEDTAQRFRVGRDQPRDTDAPADFKDMVGYEYWGEVPWKAKDGRERRVITVLNNVEVRDDPFPYSDPNLPFHTLIINPMQGRFYGLAPAEIIRYDQDFADAIKILLAEAIIRQVHPPLVYDPEAEIDVAKLRAWKADAPIASRGGINSVGTLQYGADIGAGFAMLSGLKEFMQQGSGATAPIMGADGPSREAATVGAFRIQSAMDRPELAASVLENECLPPIALGILRRYQQFVNDDEDLKLRVGELPEPYWIGDIMGDFDIEFIGSRMAMSRQEKLQAYDRLVAMANAIPAFAAMVPWQDIAQHIIGDELELPEVAGRIGGQQTVMLNALLAQVMGQGADNGNNAQTASQPAGQLTAAASGGVAG